MTKLGQFKYPCRVMPIDDTVDTRTPAQRSAGFQKPGTVTRNGGWLVKRPTVRDPNRRHLGLDLAGVEGTPVRAPCAGRIVAVWYDGKTKPFSDYGPAGVMIEEDGGKYFHVLAHLAVDSIFPPGSYPAAAGPQPQKSIVWIDGPAVRCGQPIGATGAPNHCHWEIRTQKLWTQTASRSTIAVDPMAWLKDGDPTPQTWSRPWWQRSAGPSWLNPFPAKPSTPTVAVVPSSPAPPPAAGGGGIVLVVLALLLLADDRKRRRRRRG